ncbi:MAG: hypothetical protein M1166_07765 [Candidatus Thermoplasmatota archaeon]|nr:hypothetical protein [Candidatus Thermoplasmatota archaeon]
MKNLLFNISESFQFTMGDGIRVLVNLLIKDIRLSREIYAFDHELSSLSFKSETAHGYRRRVITTRILRKLSKSRALSKITDIFYKKFDSNMLVNSFSFPIFVISDLESSDKLNYETVLRTKGRRSIGILSDYDLFSDILVSDEERHIRTYVKVTKFYDTVINLVHRNNAVKVEKWVKTWVLSLN